MKTLQEEPQRSSGFADIVVIIFIVLAVGITFLLDEFRCRAILRHRIHHDDDVPRPSGQVADFSDGCQRSRIVIDDEEEKRGQFLGSMLDFDEIRRPIADLRIVEGDLPRLKVGYGEFVSPRRWIARAAEEHVVLAFVTLLMDRTSNERVGEELDAERPLRTKQVEELKGPFELQSAA